MEQAPSWPFGLAGAADSIRVMTRVIPALKASSPGGRSADQIANAVREIGRGTSLGTVFHLAGLAFVELYMPNADQLPRAAVIPVFLCFLLLRFLGFYMTLRERGSVELRLRVLAAGALGANLVWGLRVVGVQLHTGGSQEANVMAVIILGLATGALTAFAPSLWLQRAALAVLFVPLVVVGCAGIGPGALAVLYALFFLYMLAQGTAAHRKYWVSVHAAKALSDHAEAAELAAIAAAESNLQLRTEIAHSAKMEIELRQAQKLEAIGRLAAGIAHEINTPLQFIGDSCSFLIEGIEQLTGAMEDYRHTFDHLADGKLATAAALVQIAGIDERRDVTYLREQLASSALLAQDGLHRISKIVVATKEFAYPHRKEKVLADINKAIASTLIISNSETRYVADVAAELGELPPLLCHPGELNQVILNLIVNAAHAIGDVVKTTGGRGVIRIKTWAAADRVRISVADTGTGMPAEILDKIFEPFFTTKPVGSGTGQGLAICRSAIVDKHGGTIGVSSELGVGTTFTISLPIAQPPEALHPRRGLLADSRA